MYKFAIRNKVYDNKIVAWLYYEEKQRKYKIEIPEYTKYEEAPLMIAEFIKKNQRIIDHAWSLRWIQERVIPPERQNIGCILRENNMKFYDEFPFLLLNRGRSCQDECYLEQI